MKLIDWILQFLRKLLFEKSIPEDVSNPTPKKVILPNPKIYNPKEFNSNAEQIIYKLRYNNIPEKGIIAILANLYVESRFKNNAVGDVTLPGGTSVGIAQWRGDRKIFLFEFAKKQGINIKNGIPLSIQVEYLINEMKLPYYKKTWDAINDKTLSVEEIAGIFCSNFERPANVTNESVKRGEIANQIILNHSNKFKL
jgi:hypothetical protein